MIINEITIQLILKIVGIFSSLQIGILCLVASKRALYQGSEPIRLLFWSGLTFTSIALFRLTETVGWLSIEQIRDSITMIYVLVLVCLLFEKNGWLSNRNNQQDLAKPVTSD